VTPVTTNKHMQVIDYVDIVAKEKDTTLSDAFSRASDTFDIPEKELRRNYEIHQLKLKLTKQAAEVKKYQKRSR
jgi:hypothetical protein